MPKQKPVREIRGVYAALATPRRSNSSNVDTAAFFDYQDAVARAGVDGLVLFGSTGEFVHLDITDRVQAVSLICKRSRVPVLVNVSHSSLDGALTLAEAGIAADAAGLLVMPPYFYRYTEPQILAFYKQFAETLGRRARLFLYNLPFFTNPLSYPVIETLLVSGEYEGIKDSSGDRELFQRLAELHGQRAFTWFAGNESIYSEVRSAGAEGIISGVAAAIPELILALDRAIATHSAHVISRFEQMLDDFLVWLNKFPSTVAIKQAAVVRGWKLDQAAFRFDEDTQTEIRAFRKWLESWLPRVLAECGELAGVRT
jgi:dihydrodipicolinate synthase/N-acetylneuraminate lyase